MSRKHNSNLCLQTGDNNWPITHCDHFSIYNTSTRLYCISFDFSKVHCKIQVKKPQQIGYLTAGCWMTCRAGPTGCKDLKGLGQNIWHNHFTLTYYIYKMASRIGYLPGGCWMLATCCAVPTGCKNLKGLGQHLYWLHTTYMKPDWLPARRLLNADDLPRWAHRL